MENYKPILSFDMDETLIESNASHISAYKHMLKVMNLKKDKVDWKEIIRQKTRYEAVELLCPELNKANIERGVKIYMDYLNKHSYQLVKRKPFALEILKKLKKDHRLIIITNCTFNNTKALLENGGKIPIKYFELILGSDNVKEVKPSAEPFLKAEKILNERIDYHIGDSINDIKAAKLANIRVISVATGNHPISELKLYKPDHIIKNLKGLIKILKLK